MGRLARYSEPTDTISFRVPKSKIKKVKSIVKKLLKTYEPNRHKKRIKLSYRCY